MEVKFRSPLLMLFMALLAPIAFAQQKVVSGKVTDENNVPLPGVNIVITGTSSGTQTDFDGNYSIQVAEGAVLEFSYVGFETTKETVGSGSTINVTLGEDSQALEEVVVTAFGRKMTRNESTSNVVSVGADELSKHNNTSATESLQGKVSGLVLNNPSGTPGSAPVIRIRGMNSVTASNDPLYVLDGVPINSESVGGDGNSTIDIFAMINPSDIEEISVLKDASAVAPYGADGANGVILITTKEGKRGEARYNLRVSGGFQNFTVEGPEMASSEQRWDAIQEGLWNYYGPELGNGRITDRSQIEELARTVVPTFNEWEANGRAFTDWRDVVTNKNAFKGDVNFSVSQGTDKYNFNASLGFNKTDGVLIGTGFRRWTGFVKYKSDLNDRLRFNLSANVSNASQDGTFEHNGIYASFANPLSAVYLMTPWVNLQNADGTPNLSEEDWYVFGTNHNFPWMLEHDIMNSDITRAITSAGIEYDILENLTFRSTLGLDYTLRYYKTYSNPIHSGGRDVNGTVNERSYRMYQYTTQNSLDYNFSIEDKHNFMITALQEFTKYKNNMLQGFGQNMANDELKNISAASADYDANSTYSDAMNLRLVGLLNYNFDKKYLLDASLSYQGDSRFSEHFDTFYSLGLGWNLHREEFIENIDFIDVLRLKAGYGITGNAGIRRNQYQELLGFTTYNNMPAGTIDGFGTDARWEKSTRRDVSMDFGFLNNKLRGSMGVFSNVTSDMLFRVPIPLSAQFDDARITQNMGEMKNNGFELSLSGDVIATQDFKWNLSGNISTLNNYISKLPSEATITEDANIVQQGHPVFEWYMPEWKGVNPDNGMPEWYVDRSVNDDVTNKVSEAARAYIGTNALPTYTGSISTRVDYKNFFLEGTFYFEGGNQVYDHWAKHTQNTHAANLNNGNISAEAVKQAWRNPGDISERFPRFDWNNTEISSSLSEINTRNLHDGDFLRLQDVGIGYTFKDMGITEALGIDNLSLSVRGSNLVTWLKAKHLDYDPTARTMNGRIIMGTPPVKSVTFNLNLNF